MSFYIYDVEYDPHNNISRTILWSDEDGSFYYLNDQANHRPYFLLVPRERVNVRRIVAVLERLTGSTIIINDKEYHVPELEWEIVELLDRVRMRKVKALKVYVERPSDVPILRRLFRYETKRCEKVVGEDGKEREECWFEYKDGPYGDVATAYESDIKYVRNYFLDMKYEAWMPYNVVRRGRRVQLAPAFEESEDGFSHLFEAPIPVPKVISFDIEVLPEERWRVPNPDNPKQPVISIAVVYEDDEGKARRKYFVLREWCPEGVRRSSKDEADGQRAEVECFDDEAEMLRSFFDFIDRSDRLVIGYNIEGFDVPYLVNRARRLGISDEEIPFVRSGSVPRGRHPVTDKDFEFWEMRNSRLIDLFMIFGNTSIANYTYGGAYESYKLEDIAQALLGHGKEFHGEKSILDMTPDELMKYNLTDAQLVYELWKHDNHLLWRVVVLIARISRLPVGQLVRSSISTWIGNMMMYFHRRNNYLIPNRADLFGKSRARSKSKTGKQYAGAVVLEPPRGVFRDVHVLDFASLYPTIVIRYNLSYETVNPLFPCKSYHTVPEVGHKVCDDVRGIAPAILEVLRDLRVHRYKKLAKSWKKKYEETNDEEAKEKAEFYDAVQLTIKVFINASYGVFGNKGFRFFEPGVAESVTAYGRHILTRTKEWMEKQFNDLGVHVLYGDSVVGDSVVIVSTDGERWEAVPIEEVFERYARDVVKRPDGKEEAYPPNLWTLTIENGRVVKARVRRLIRHKTNKMIYEVCADIDRCVKVTEDHSIMDPLGRPVKAYNVKEVVVVHDPFEAKIITTKKAKVRSLGRTERYVYDMEVEGSHTFLANFIWVHNTDSLFVKCEKCNDKGDWQRLIEETSKWVQEKFGMEIELDKVFDVLVLTGRKKNYAGVLKDSDKVVIKGMIAKKRDAPKWVKDVFYNIVDMLPALAKNEITIETFKKRAEERVRKALDDLYAGRVALEDVAKWFQVKRDADEYKGKNSIPAQVLRALTVAGIQYEIGELVGYVKFAQPLTIVKEGLESGFGKAREVVRTEWVPIKVIMDRKELMKRWWTLLDKKKYEEWLKGALEQLFDGFGMRVPVGGAAKTSSLLAFLNGAKKRKR